MSVNQVNVAPQQQIQQQGGGFSLAPAIGLGAIGAVAGGAVGKRPGLERVLGLSKDVFESATKDLEGEAKTAATTISNARKEILSEVKTIRKTPQQKYGNAIKSFKLGDDAQEVKAYKEAKKAFKTKLTELKNANKSNIEISEALKGSTEVNNYRATKKALRAAQEKGLRASTDETMKTVVKNFDDAVTSAAKAKTDKITNLLKDENITKAFSKIKNNFVKVDRWKTAGIWGGIAAGVGLLLGLFMAGSKKTQAQ